MPKLSLSASLVVYKPDLDVLERTLLALQRAGQEVKASYDISLELTLVDNYNKESWHGRLESWVAAHEGMMPDWELRLLHAHDNIGYGHGNNLVIEQTKSDYHLVINPDLFVEPDALLQSLRFMEAHPDAGLLTPAVFGDDNERHYLCKRNPTLFVMFLRSYAPSWIRKMFQEHLTRFEMRDCNYDEQFEGIEFPSGCFMFFRTKILRQLGGFDTRYFLYFEDADIGRRILEVARVVYVPSVKVIHLWERGTHNNWRLRWQTVKSAMIYYKKWGGIF